MTLHRAHPSERGSSMHGFSMLEVLIAVLVFSLGMIGLAGLLIYSMQSNHIAYLRTQATFLAHNMADRMGANPVGVWNGDYGTKATPKVFPVATSPLLSCAAGCTPDALAAYDVQQWGIQLSSFLPDAAGTIECDASSLSYTPTQGADGQVMFRPPYGGICTMTLTWNEAKSATGVHKPQSFAWKFQP